MRSKEDALDYRYFPEPDLPPLVISNEMMKWLDSQALEISHDIIKNMKEEYGFSKEYINALIGDKRTLDYFLSIFSELKSSILKFIPQVAGEPSSFTKDDKLSPFAKGEV
ncbi:hypothetical protein KKG31_01385 [Patescibacteria group bacterium]|nr:hypothetical protein [Patescibacteria group bacterium]MBU1757830.1 hypothetical protein [Patescibacteria group bacterium]